MKKLLIFLAAFVMTACNDNDGQSTPNPLEGSWLEAECKANNYDSFKTILEFRGQTVLQGQLRFNNTTCLGRPIEVIRDSAENVSVAPSTLSVSNNQKTITLEYTMASSNSFTILVSKLDPQEEDIKYQRILVNYLSENLDKNSNPLPEPKLTADNNNEAGGPTSEDLQKTTEALNNSSSPGDLQFAFSNLGIQFNLDTISGGSGAPSYFGSGGFGTSSKSNSTMKKEQRYLKKLAEIFADPEVINLLIEKKVKKIEVSNPYRAHKFSDNWVYLRQPYILAADIEKIIGYQPYSELSVSIGASKEHIVKKLLDFKILTNEDLSEAY